MAEVPHGVDGVLVAVAGGKLENGKIHGLNQFWSPITKTEKTNGQKILCLCALTAKDSFNLQFVIFNHRVAQELCAASLMAWLPPLCLCRARGQSRCICRCGRR